MENTLNTKFINISDRKFKKTVYEDTSYSGLGYKPNAAFWVAKESKNPNSVSRWDDEYEDLAFEEDENGFSYITTIQYNPNTFILNPGAEDNYVRYLSEFDRFIREKEKVTIISDKDKRKLFLNFIKDKLNLPKEIEYIACQIDTVDDIDILEQAFGHYHFGETNPDEVYENMQYNVRRGLTECFSSVEVTDFFLGNEEFSTDDIQDYLDEKSSMDSKYHGNIGCWDVHSIAFFDTNAFNVLEERKIDVQEFLESRENTQDFDER